MRWAGLLLIAGMVLLIAWLGRYVADAADKAEWRFNVEQRCLIAGGQFRYQDDQRTQLDCWGSTAARPEPVKLFTVVYEPQH